MNAISQIVEVDFQRTPREVECSLVSMLLMQREALVVADVVSTDDQGMARIRHHLGAAMAANAAMLAMFGIEI